MYNAITGASAAPPATAAGADNALYRKVSGHIIPFLFICYVISFLDRINIGFAQSADEARPRFQRRDVRTGRGGFLSSAMSCSKCRAICCWRNMARARPSLRIMLLWGCAPPCQMAWVSTPMQFYLLRFTLGVFEAGFFPGIVLYLTYWYPPLRRASVLSFFFAGVAVAGVIGGLVSGWIMRDMAGVLGLKGWQWMFALEGAPALALAVIALLLSR